MYRHFTNRVLGGVCGGMAPLLGGNSWLLRLLFVVGAPLTSGFAALYYLALWWWLPQESPIGEPRGRALNVLFALLLAVAFAAVWFGWRDGWLVNPDGESLVLQSVLLILSVVLLLRQLRA